MKTDFILTLILLLILELLLNSPIIAQKNNYDSTNSADKNSIFIPINDFTYAGKIRYTIDGSLPLKKTKIKPVTMSIIGGVYLSMLIGIHLHQQQAWWSNNRSKFHFQEDWSYALQVDKIGHIYGGYLTSYFICEGLTASGIKWDNANIYGAIFGLLFQTYVEVEDGFAKNWGFSPSDWYFDVIGSGYFLLQHYVKFFQNITPKWQYIPSEWTGKPIINRPRTFIDDYNSSTFWYSIKVSNLLPENWKKYYPKWLNIAFGYGADAIDAKPDPNNHQDVLASRRYTIGIDYDLVELLPDGFAFWNWFKQTLNYIKLPSPALELSNKKVRFHLLYPFKIKIGSIHF